MSAARRALHDDGWQSLENPRHRRRPLALGLPALALPLVGVGAAFGSWSCAWPTSLRTSHRPVRTPASARGRLFRPAPRTGESARRPRVSRAALAIGSAASAASLLALGLAPGASAAELRRAYRSRARRFHPDGAVARGLEPREAAEQFMRINLAYRDLLTKLRPVAASPQESAKSEDGDVPPEGVEEWNGRFSWELSVADVVSDLSENALRAILWNSLGWGLRRGASSEWGSKLPPRSAGRSALQAALMPLLDEVVRREILLRQAEAAGDTAQVQRLRGGRSERHRVRDAWQAAVARSGSADPEAQELQERFETLTEARADVTSDEGAYPAEWDRSVADIAEIRKDRRTKEAKSAGMQNTGMPKGLTGFYRLAAKAAARRPRNAQPSGRASREA